MFELEIVEELTSQDSDLVSAQLLAISSLGVRLSIVDGLPSSEDDQCISQSIIGLALGMNLDLVAEGAETKSRVDGLIEKGFDYLQGNLYSKPLTLKKNVSKFFK